MKTPFILLIALLFLNISGVYAQKPYIMIIVSETVDMKDPNAFSAVDIMESFILKEGRKRIPCATINTMGAIQAYLAFSKTQALAGTDVNTFENIKGALGVNYVIILSANSLNNMILCKATCYYFKKTEFIAEGFLRAPVNDTWECCSQVVKELMDQLEEYEICAYEGKVNIKVESEKEETTSSSNPCDNGMIVTQTKVKTKMNLNWELNKNGRRQGDGNVTYDMNENTETTINNPCYICPDGQKTIAQINEKKDVEAKASGLTNESVSEGQKVADCRIKIVFLDDGTYTILVEATSQKGNMKTTIDKKVNAPCPAGKDEKPEEPRNNEIEVPLKVVLGPYKGTAEDKVLSQDENKDLSQGKEKTTVKINFSLTRQ